MVILAGDHIYKMDYGKLVAFHQEKEADLTIARPARAGRTRPRQFGIMQIDGDGRIIGFEEKPAEPKTIPGDPEHCLASMGIYVFNARFLFEQLCHDATLPDSAHDFGRNIIPVADRHAPRVSPFRSATRTASRTPTGATSARSTPTTKPTWT